MELKQLSYFIQIIHDKSFSQAAKSLYLTQQAISKAIRNLEEELGVPLFNRTSSGLELTEYGVLLQIRAIEILTHSSQAITEISKLRKKQEKSISLVMSYGFTHGFSPDFFTLFNLAFPDIELAIRDYPDLICENLIINDEADIGCIVGPIDNNSLESTLLLSEDLYMLINDRNQLLKIDNITMNDLKDQEFILHTDDFKLPSSFKSCCERNGFTPKVSFVSNEMTFLKRLVHFNKGIAIVPEHSIAQLAYPNIRSRIFPDPSLSWDVYLVKRKYQPYSDAVKTLWDFLYDSL